MNGKAIVHALYKKLLSLYPQGFRERLGESMDQTFNDLYDERKQNNEPGLFGFVLWMFIETAIGILPEHVLLIKELNPMKNILTSLRLPVIISFLIILPFVVLELTTVIIKGLTFDRRDALDSLVTFGFLWLGLAAILLILVPIVRTVRNGYNSMADPAPVRGNTLLTNPTSAAIISLILALPFLTILSLLIFQIEPPFAYLLNNPDPDQPNVIGTLVVLGALLLAVAGCLVARVPLVRGLQAGGNLFAHPLHLILATVILFFITMLVVGLIVDQFPCWIGVPNCD